MRVRRSIKRFIKICDQNKVTILGHGVGKNKVRFIRARASTKNGDINIFVQFTELKQESAFEFPPLAETLVVIDAVGKKLVDWDRSMRFRPMFLIIGDIDRLIPTIKLLRKQAGFNKPKLHAIG